MKIEVRILEAKDLKVTDYFDGTSDPYVRITINGQMQKTKVCHRTTQPKFFQSFQFDIIPGQQITFEIFSFDEVGRDDLLGSVVHSLTALHQGQVCDLWLPLSKKGEIHVQILSPTNLPNSIGSKNNKNTNMIVQGESIEIDSNVIQTPKLGHKFFGYCPLYDNL